MFYSFSILDHKGHKSRYNWAEWQNARFGERRVHKPSRDGSSARRRRKRFGRHLSFYWLPRQSSPQAPDATDFKGETLTFTKSTTKRKFSFLVLGSVVYRTSTQLLETLLLACFHERELRPALKWYDKAQSNASSLTTFGIAPVEFTNRLETARLQSNLTAIAPCS